MPGRGKIVQGTKNRFAGHGGGKWQRKGGGPRRVNADLTRGADLEMVRTQWLVTRRNLI